MSTSDLLDDSGFNRPFWVYARRWPGHAGYYFGLGSPAMGQMLTFDASTLYGVKATARRQGMHSAVFFPGKQGYLLFAAEHGDDPDVGLDKAGKVRADPAWKEPVRQPPAKWLSWTPILVRAMVLTGTPAKDGASPTLFVCGPPDVVDAADPLAAYEGRAGAILRAVSAADGKTLAELRLDTPPVWDGLIAAEGRLYASLADGSVVCLAEAK
jgi:hypothetical protein